LIIYTKFIVFKKVKFEAAEKDTPDKNLIGCNSYNTLTMVNPM